jgi:arabinose-5-phosphate isomerase
MLYTACFIQALNLPMTTHIATNDSDDQQLCQFGRLVIETELQAVQALTNRIDATFAKACHYILACQGRVVVIGMGKSGHIGNKLASTLASTGTPALFVHPGEASHGDLGMITPNDVVLAISYSGRTHEILTILPLIKRWDIPLISLTGDPESPLARMANVNLNIQVKEEACPLGLAPTSSTTATLVMGDALAIALLQARNFTAEDFALSHPGGTLGKRLLLRLSDIMRTGKQIPLIKEQAMLSDALVEMSEKGMGMTAVVNERSQLLGVYTDGDLRRTLDNGYDIRSIKIAEVMTKNCKTISANVLAVECLEMMEKHRITSLLIVDDKHIPVGAIHMHDLLRAGIV